jgi:hypothetical protein
MVLAGAGHDDAGFTALRNGEFGGACGLDPLAIPRQPEERPALQHVTLDGIEVAQIGALDRAPDHVARCRPYLAGDVARLDAEKFNSGLD